MTGQGRSQQQDSDRRTGRFAEPHIEVEKRPHPDLAQQRPVGGFRRDMCRPAMVQNRGIETYQGHDGGSSNEAIEQDRGVAVSRRLLMQSALYIRLACTRPGAILQKNPS